MKNAKVEGDFKLDVSSWEFIWEIGLAASYVRKASVTYWTANLEKFYLFHILYICYFVDLIQVPKNSLQVAYCFLFVCFCIVSFPLKLGGVGGRGFFFLKFGERGGSWKKFSEIRMLVQRGTVLLERGCFQIVSSVFLQKSMFLLLLDFFCLVNIHACCKQ